MDIPSTHDAGTASSPVTDLNPADSTPREQAHYPDDQPTTEPPKEDAPAANDPTSDAPQERPSNEEYKLEMPEGVELDPELLSSAVPLLKEAGVTNDQANQLVPIVTQMQERFYKQQVDAFLVMKADWAKEAQADPEIGGDSYKETVRLAGVALKAGGKAMSAAQEVLNESGVGNHPAMIRLFRNIGAEFERRGAKEIEAVKNESVIERARRLHQEQVYPDDTPKQTFEEMVANTKGKPRPHSRYPDDER